jgi:hypothetical protein
MGEIGALTTFGDSIIRGCLPAIAPTRQSPEEKSMADRESRSHGVLIEQAYAAV